MSNSKKDQCISVQVPPELKAKARSLSRYVRLVLRSHIREYELLYGPVSTDP